jgi:hypothetical protein
MIPAAAILLLGPMSHAHAQGAGINFKLDFDAMVDCTQPIAARNLTVHGSGTGVLNLDKSGSADLNLSGAVSSTIHFEGRLGQGAAPAPGGSAQFRVVGRNRLRLTWDLPNNQLSTVIAISGRGCSAVVDSRLKPGRAQYTLYDGSTYHYCGRPAISHASCSVY